MSEPAGGPPGPSPLIILAGILLVVAAFCGLMGFSDPGPHVALYRGLCWICGSLALIAAYWDHEHRRFK